MAFRAACLGAGAQSRDSRCLRTDEPSPARPLPAPAPAELYVRCLGGFSVSYQGRLVDLGTSREREAAVQVSGGESAWPVASKELLAEVLWPGAPLDRALVSLQTAVHQLRRAMGASEKDLLGTPGDCVRRRSLRAEPCAPRSKPTWSFFNRCRGRGFNRTGRSRVPAPVRPTRWHLRPMGASCCPRSVRDLGRGRAASSRGAAPRDPDESAADRAGAWHLSGSLARWSAAARG